MPISMMGFVVFSQLELNETIGQGPGWLLARSCGPCRIRAEKYTLFCSERASRNYLGAKPTLHRAVPRRMSRSKSGAGFDRN